MKTDKENMMTTIQPILFAISLFLALASLLRWKYLRQDTGHRVSRSLRSYLTLSTAPRLEIA